MNPADPSTQSNNSLENVLKELEERFVPKKEEPVLLSSFQKKPGINFAHSMKNRVIGGLTLTLLIVGAVAGVYLGQQSTENRQRASTAYPSCGEGSVGNCAGALAGSGCNVSGFPGTCKNSETSPACTCELNSQPTMTPACLKLGDGCANQGTGQNPCCAPLSCQITGPNNQTTCVAAATSTPGPTVIVPSITPIPPTNVPATNTPVPPTNVPATNTPIPPTNVPATNTPVRTNTPVPPTSTRTTTPSLTPTRTVTPAIGPTCNSIAMSYAMDQPNRPPKLGDNLTFTCASIANAVRYEFRIFQNGILFDTINPSANGARVSEPFPVEAIGHYDAQCRACAGTADNTCQQWEPL